MSLLRSYLETNAILPASDLETAERHKQAQGGSLDTALLELGLLTAAELLEHLSKACGLPPIPARLLETGPTRPQGHVPKAMLDIGWVLPLALEDGQLLAAVHPDLPDARLGQLYRQIRGFTPMVAPECCLAKLNAERTGSIVAPRFAMLVLDVLDALQAREPAGTTLVGVPIAAPAPTPAPAPAPAPAAPLNAPAAPAHAAFTIPYAAAGPQVAVHADGPAGPPPPARPAPQVPPPAAADSISATVVEPVLEDSLIDAAGESLTAATTLSQPTATHDPAIGGTFPRGDSAPYLAASSGEFPSQARARAAAAQKDSRAASGPQDSRVAAAYAPKDSREPAAATPVPKDSRPVSGPKDSRPAATPTATATPAPTTPAPAHSAPAPQPDRRRPPSGTVAAPVLQDSRPADAAPSPAPRSHPRSGGVSTSRSAPLPQLPLAQRLAPARAALAQARERDRITESLVRAAIQVAPRVALFGVKREGLRALAAPGSSLHLPRSLVIPIPDGSLLDRAVSGEIRLRLLTEPQLAFAVGRPLGIPCILEPVYAQSRCVLMLYIDRSGGPFEVSEQTAVRDLCDVARGSLEALLRIMGLGTRGDASSTSMRVEPASDLLQVVPADASAPTPDAYVATPEPAPTPDAYVATPEPAPAPDVWLTRGDPPASDPPAPASDSTSEPAAPASEPPAKSEPQPGRTSEMDGVPELTRRPRRAVIALVNPIRREPPTSLEPSARGWIAAREQYGRAPSEPPAADSDAPTSADPQAPTRRLPAADADALVDAILEPVPADSSAETTLADSPASAAPAQAASPALDAAPPAAAPAEPPVPADSGAAPGASTVSAAPDNAVGPTDTATSAAPAAGSAGPATAHAAPDGSTATTDTAAASVPADSAAPAGSAAESVSPDRSTTPADPAAASVQTDSAAASVSADSATATADTVAASASTDSSSATTDTAVASVSTDRSTTPADTAELAPTDASAPVLTDSSTAPAAPVPADSSAAPVPADSSAAPAPADSSTDAPSPAPRTLLPTAAAAPVPTDSSDPDPQTDPDPSASTSGLHMPNLVAPGVKRTAGKRGDRTRPAVEPAVVIPYDLRRPEHRTSPPKTARPRPGVQIPSSLLAPAPLPGSARKGKSPQHPTPPRADDVTLNMPMLVRSPTSLPPEPATDVTDATEASLPPELATPELRAPTLLEIPALTDTPAAELAEPPAEPPAPPAPATDLSQAPAPTPAEPAADLSQAPAASEPTAPAAPATDEQLDAALAAYLHNPDDPAALAALIDLGAAVYPRIAARFPGPIDPRSASDVRSFPPPSVHGPLLRACVEIGAPIAPHILELLEHQRPQIRFYAAFLFQELRDLRSLSPLAAHAFDPDADVRLIATRVLESYNRHPKFAAATEHVRAALTGRDRDRALLATEAAGTLRDTRAVPILIDLLSVRDKQIREAALEALCSITAKHHGYRPAKWKSWYADHGEQPRVLWVMDALKHRDPAVRRWAADELHRVTGHRLPPPPEGEKITPRYVLQSWEAWWTEHGAAFR